MRRALVILAILTFWGALLGLGLWMDGREVAIPSFGSVGVQTYTLPPDPPRPVPFPQSTLPPTWERLES